MCYVRSFIGGIRVRVPACLPACLPYCMAAVEAIGVRAKRPDDSLRTRRLSAVRCTVHTFAERAVCLDR